jgi:hypothetical protein
MSKVFVGGSRTIGCLHPEVRTRLGNMITDNHMVLVGDADGVDAAVQTFFAEEGYKDVVVYCMEGVCRNNVGCAPVKAVDSGGKKKDFAYFATKDFYASLDADYGFMIWDGESKGTLNNVLNLIQQGKRVVVYRSASGEFLDVRSREDIVSLVSRCPSDVLQYLNKKINLEKRLAESHQPSLGL